MSYAIASCSDAISNLVSKRLAEACCVYATKATVLSLTQKLDDIARKAYTWCARSIKPFNKTIEKLATLWLHVLVIFFREYRTHLCQVRIDTRKLPFMVPPLRNVLKAVNCVNKLFNKVDSRLQKNQKSMLSTLEAREWCWNFTSLDH